MKLDELNALEPVRFVAALAGVFEHSPWIGATVYDRRPFHSIDDLHGAMIEILQDAPADAQLALLRAHPELASKAAMRGELTVESNQEQADAELTCCTAAEFARLCALNRAYDAKFGFPCRCQGALSHGDHRALRRAPRARPGERVRDGTGRGCAHRALPTRSADRRRAANG